MQAALVDLSRHLFRVLYYICPTSSHTAYMSAVCDLVLLSLPADPHEDPDDDHHQEEAAAQRHPQQRGQRVRLLAALVRNLR